MLPPSAWTLMSGVAAPAPTVAPARQPAKVIPIDPSRTVRPHDVDLSIRRARLDDIHAIGHLAALDSANPVAGDVLLAEADGRLVAALDVISGRSIADPFTHTAHAVELLEARARQLHAGTGRARRQSRSVAGAFVRAVAGR